MKEVEKRLNSRIAAETGEGIGALDEALHSSVEKISEILPAKVSEQGTASISKTTKSLSLWQKISSLLSSPEHKRIELPSAFIQRQEIRASLERETKHLLREAAKIEKQKNFSAAALEEVIRQIRYLRQLIGELITMAVQKLEQLYRQYVLKLS